MPALASSSFTELFPPIVRSKSANNICEVSILNSCHGAINVFLLLVCQDDDYHALWWGTQAITYAVILLNNNIVLNDIEVY